MFPETGMLFSYLPAFPSEFHGHFHPMEEELFSRLQDNSGHLLPLDNVARSMMASEYDLGGGVELFKAPEAIEEDPTAEMDPVAAAMWMISNGDPVVPLSTFEVEPIQNDQLLLEAFYDPPAAALPEIPAADEGIRKSVSSGSLESSTRYAKAPPNLSAVAGIFPGDSFGIRRACSEGDLHRYRGGGTSFSGGAIHVISFDRMLSIGEEARQQKLSRYRKKRTRRNFGRKIKYACRKALADSQPRVKGRFAKTEDSETSLSNPPTSST
ncbi:uncharacterized protein LOC144703094 isoform X2 [Wolffia australiana]